MFNGIDVHGVTTIQAIPCNFKMQTFSNCWGRLPSIEIGNISFDFSDFFYFFTGSQIRFVLEFEAHWRRESCSCSDDTASCLQDVADTLFHLYVCSFFATSSSIQESSSRHSSSRGSFFLYCIYPCGSIQF